MVPLCHHAGEETYTLQLLWANRVSKHFPECTLELVGTDISHDNIDGAKRGVYPPHALVELPPQWVLDSFDEAEPGNNSPLASGPTDREWRVYELGVGGAERFRLRDELRSHTNFIQQVPTICCSHTFYTVNIHCCTTAHCIVTPRRTGCHHSDSTNPRWKAV